METAVLIGLAIVVALVSVVAMARIDERRRRDPPSDTERDPNVSTTQKIVVDLSKRN